MPPRSPLPDLCLIAIFQMQTLNDQLIASMMSPRSAILVRAANRRVKSLVITCYGIEETASTISSLLFASKPSMKQLKDAGEAFPDYPTTTSHLSEWNCLQLSIYRTHDQTALNQIVNAFSAITDLKFIYESSSTNLATLLQHPQWTGQLINLMVVHNKNCSTLFLYKQHGLCAAINGLSALQCLAVKTSDCTVWPLNLATAFSRLNVLTVEHLWNCRRFLNALERSGAASSNEHLQVHLLTYDNWQTLRLSEPIRRRVVRLGKSPLRGREVSTLVGLLPGLTSLAVYLDTSNIVPIFTSLSQLAQLVHLHLIINLERIPFVEEPLPRPLVQLPSVRALDLHLTIRSHSQVEWLNLQWALPNLQAIHLINIQCGKCDVNLRAYLSGDYSQAKSLAALECFQAALSKLYSGVPPGRITVGVDKPYLSLEQVLQSAGQ